MSNDEALGHAQALYDFVRAALDDDPSEASDKRYRQLRKTVLDDVGLEALPLSVRNGRTVYDYLRNVSERTETIGENRSFLKQEFNPLFDLLESGRSTPTRPLAGVSKPQLDIFISHSSADRSLAEALLDLLVYTLRIAPDSIRCTSVEGSGVKGGERFEDRLRSDIVGCRIFIALVTPAMLRSHYSLFELGARWGLDAFTDDGLGGVWKVLIARGVDGAKLPDPLAQRHFLDLGNRADAEQFLREVAEILECKVGAADRHLKNVTAKAGVPAGFRGADLTSPELRILRALVGEKDGRLLTNYRENYKDAVARLTAMGYIHDVGGMLKLRTAGNQVAREYLLSILETE